MRLARILLVLAFVLSGPVTALAQVDEGLARREFEAAATEFGRSNYALALQGFQRAYDMLEGHPRRPLVLFNIGRCYEELGRFQEARDAYTRYLRDAGADAIDREETEARLRELETRLNMEQGAGDSPAHEDAEHDTRAAGSSAGRGEQADMAPVGDGVVSPLGPILLGVGGAALLAGAITGGLALSQRSDFIDSCMDTMCPESSRGLADDVQALALSTDILLFGGLLVAATGALLTVFLRDGGASDTAVSMGCSTEGCMALFTGEVN